MGTRFTRLVGCELPIQLAAMGGVGTTELANAVASAGGFGMVPSSVPPGPDACGINYLMPFVPSAEMIRESARGVRVVEFAFGDPQRELVAAVHEGGALAGWQVGSVAAAVAAAEVGCDYVVAQGTEAGGHLCGTQRLGEILPDVLTSVRLPVLAAGGVATPERVLELLRLGADGVRVGTRFVATRESGAHPDYVKYLIEATATDTVITEWFGAGWEAAPHRVLKTALDAARKTGWRETTPPYVGLQREVADMALYAGMGVGDVTSVESARDVVRGLVRLI